MDLNHLKNTTMDPDSYQADASRTRAPQDKVIYRIHELGNNCKGVQLLHAIIGMTGEIGEIAGAYEKFAYYGQTLDESNLKEELGDVLWYIAEACDALGLSLQEVMKSNIRKLRSRYPDKYADDLAKEDNRNREAEMKEVEYVDGKPEDDAVYKYLIKNAQKDYERRLKRYQDDGVTYEE